ncbi:MAG: endopeptidase La [Gammaproteobacteria bacterium]|nr:MAG: endopeptidase La [Gammaproteobacteria bacterium]
MATATDDIHKIETIPLLPLRDLVVFPGMVVPLFIGRKKSINAINIATKNHQNIFLSTQKTSKTNSPKLKDLYKVGTVANILQLVKLPDNTIKVLIEGRHRAVSTEIRNNSQNFVADYITLYDKKHRYNKVSEALSRSVLSVFEQYVRINRKIPTDILSSVLNTTNYGAMCDVVSAHIKLKLTDKQTILETVELDSRMEIILKYLEKELEVLQIEQKIHSKVRKQMDKNQKEYYVNEQIKVLKKEINKDDDADDEEELKEIESKITKIKMSSEAKEKCQKEFKKLKKMHLMSSEATVIRNYLDVIFDLPWDKKSRLEKTLNKAQNILEKDHYGLNEVKTRITEHLAVQNKVAKLKGPILCLVGPPGVGKTSIARSIARATKRKFIRMSLGGVRDEAQIRGHRRTYIGSMPGKIITNLSKIKNSNPLFLLDEIDKMSTDFRGDPSSALLEVLDPEQNNTFGDHYLEIDYDLSDVMFVATANSLDIPPPLLDRMEIIKISGYTEDEKTNIAQKYLIPKQIKNNGLDRKDIFFTKSAILEIVRTYTRESGVRGLEREIAKVCRKVVTKIALAPDDDKKEVKTMITPNDLEQYLGVYKFNYGKATRQNQIGQVTGLAWTQVGGELLTIEAAAFAGDGKIKYTGSLGDVMKESIETAMSVVRNRHNDLKLKKDYYKKTDIHIHVPEGATPKDGPSAGVGMCTALASVLANKKVKASVAMTGEITLRGEVLPIGGLKEKLLAAHRGGIKTVIIPSENEKDLKEIPVTILQKITIKPVLWIEEVFKIALV